GSTGSQRRNRFRGVPERHSARSDFSELRVPGEGGTQAAGTEVEKGPHGDGTGRDKVQEAKLWLQDESGGDARVGTKRSKGPAKPGLPAPGGSVARLRLLPRPCTPCPGPGRALPQSPHRRSSAPGFPGAAIHPRTHGPRAGMAGPGAAAAALLAAVLLAVLAPWAGRGGAAAPTAPNGTLEAELERRWESLVARSLARLPVAAQPKEAAVQSGAGDYLLGIKRLRRLYCNVGIGFHLQVLPDGRIGGVHADTSDSLLELSPVERGVVSIFGVAGRFFVAMSSRGKLYGSPFFTDECKFKEILLPNNYNAYECYRYPGMFIALSKNGKTKKGNRVSPTMKVTHFLPRL
ncbi:hypothetical protein EI555_000396, partial [Monodon monoceros]